MYYVSKRMEIAGAHQLKLSYESSCSNLHGHNWVITVYCKAPVLNEDGMVVDFAKVKKEIHGVLDHKFLNDIIPLNPTAENLAFWISRKITPLCAGNGYCYKVTVQESEGNIAAYVEDFYDEEEEDF